MPEKNILIQVLNYDGEGILRDCLESIRENTELNEEKYKLLVVDNGSEDSSLEVAHDLADEVIENERNLGFDIANNIGLYENPEFDYYVLMNNDTEVKKAWLSNLIETAESDKEIGVLGPKITYPDGEIQSAGFSNSKKYGQSNPRAGIDESEFNEVKEVDRVHGAAFMISSEVIDEIGYLDEIYSLGDAEEFDYCDRANRADFKIYVDGRSSVIHKEDKTKGQMENEFIYFLSLKNSLKYRAINTRPTEVIKEFYRYLKIVAASITNYKYHPPGAVYAATKEFIIDLPKIIHKRYNRTEYIPSYYCDDIKDYSKRYEKYV
jgi:GT2 family glycosyltransferase